MPRKGFSLDLYLKSHGLVSNPLLISALTHKSCTKDDPNLSNNERLEFLGDAVLKLVFSEYLSDSFPEENEGNLSKFRARLISDQLLAKLAIEIGLNRMLRLGKMLKGQKLIPDSIYGNALEALIAVIYKVLDYAQAKDFILQVWETDIQQAIHESINANYKALLIEKLQGLYAKAPSFETVEISGIDHDKQFTVAVIFEGKELGRGTANSKKEAGQNAAREALNSLKNCFTD